MVQTGTDESAIRVAKRKIKMPRAKKLRRIEFLARMASKIKNVTTMNKPLNRDAPIQRTKLRIAVLNCRGMNEVRKRRKIEHWAEEKRIDVILLCETQYAHCALEGGGQYEDLDGLITHRQWKWYFSTGVNPKVHESIDKQKKAGERIPKNMHALA